jgi:hypothetical protein
MFNFVRLSDGGIVRLNNVRSETEIITDIAIGVLEEKQISFKNFKDHQNIRRCHCSNYTRLRKNQNAWEKPRKSFKLMAGLFMSRCSKPWMQSHNESCSDSPSQRSFDRQKKVQTNVGAQ